jgi:hypothetical protein
VIVTFAAVTAPPVASVTVPLIRPPVLCACAPDAQMNARKAMQEKRRMLLHRTVRRDRFDFMNSPLSPEVLI